MPLLSLLYSDVSVDAASWVPASVLLWALGAMVGLVLSVGGVTISLARAFVAREVAKLEKVNVEHTERIKALEAIDPATREQLRSGCDSIDNHVDKTRAELQQQIDTLREHIFSLDKGTAVKFASLSRPSTKGTDD